MSTTRTLRALLLLVIVTLGAIELGEQISIPVLAGLATRVKAEVGRPLTPVSVEGVARRAATDRTRPSSPLGPRAARVSRWLLVAVLATASASTG
jgi:hypothetical protein